MPPPGKNKARCSEVVVLPQHKVGREVASAPRFEQGRRIGTEFDEEIAQLLTLECVEWDLRHVAGL
jgi:hypothetical protein